MSSCSNIFSRASHLALEAIKLPYRATCWFCGRVVKIASSIKSCLAKAMTRHTVIKGTATIRVTDIIGRSCEYRCDYSSPEVDPDTHNVRTGMPQQTATSACGRIVKIASSIKNRLVRAMTSHTVIKSESTVRVTDIHGRSFEYHGKYFSSDFDPDTHNVRTGMRRDTVASEAPRPICFESS